MKIALPIDSSQRLGGGFSFRRNIERGLLLRGHEIVSDPVQADIALICGTTMVTKETMRAIQAANTKIVVRLDNVPRNSRNKNTGTSRLKGFSDMADAIVWQCLWAKNYLGDFIQQEGEVIYNGIDLTIFTPDGAFLDTHTAKENVYLYSRYSRDETKNWEVAWYDFQLIAKQNPEAKLLLVGQFSPEQAAYNFDFFRGEKLEYLGVVDDQKRMATIMRSCGNLLATYYNDAFANTYLEAIACGVQLKHVNMSGGTPEMLAKIAAYGIAYFSLDRMAQEYEALFTRLLA